MDVFEGDFIRQMLGVLVVFGLLGAAVWKLRMGGWHRIEARPAHRVGRRQARTDATQHVGASGSRR